MANWVTLPRPHAGQVAARQNAKRFNWLACGRRWRKTTLAMSICVEAALKGETIIWTAPIYDQSKVGFEETRRAVAGCEGFRPNQSEMMWHFPTGGKIIYRSLDKPDNIRSHTAYGVVIDESGDASPVAWHEVLRPMLMDTGGWAWIVGTPKGLNWFYEGCINADQRDDSQFLTAPSLGCRIENGRIYRDPHPLENPALPFSELEQLWETTPERSFRQEYLAQFQSGEGAVFRGVDAVLTAPYTAPEQHVGHLLVGGLDWGQQADFTALSIYCCTCGHEVFLDRFNQVGWGLQRDRVLSHVSDWGVRYLLCELNSIGSPNLEQMVKDVRGQHAIDGFETTAKSKPPLIQDMALAIERKRSRWLPHSAGRMELVSYEAEKTATGHTRYGAPEGQHDDTVIARCLAWKAASARLPIPLTRHQEVEKRIPFRLQAINQPDRSSDNWDGWKMARDEAKSRAEKELSESEIGQHWQDWAGLL